MATPIRPQVAQVMQGIPVQPQNLSRQVAHPPVTVHQYVTAGQMKPSGGQQAAPVYLLTPRPAVPGRAAPQSKYAELLAVIEDMGRDIRPTYAGSRMATERLKRGIIHAKALVRECLAETERSARN